MYLEMSSAPSPDSPHSLSPDTDLLFSGFCCDSDTYFYLHLRSHKTKQADFVTCIPVAATKLHVAKSSYKIVANSQKGALASQNVLFYDFVFTLSRRMLWVSKHPLAIQQDEEQPGGSHAAGGHWRPQKRGKPLLACVSPKRQRHFLSTDISEI